MLTMTAAAAHLNGKPVARIDAAFERAVAYGDGLFETLLVRDGEVPLWPYHRARLAEGLQRLQLPVGLAQVASECEAFFAQVRTGIVKLVVARSGGGRGYDARTAHAASRYLVAYPMPAYPASYIGQGIAVHVCRQRLAQQPGLAGLKHLNRLEQVMAASEWDRNKQPEGLMLDTTGAVIEGTMSNLFVVHDGVTSTPALNSCGVAGVMRSFCLDWLAQQGKATRVRRLTLSDVLSADECFLTNSVFGLWSVRQVGIAALPTGGPVTEACRAAIFARGYRQLYA